MKTNATNRTVKKQRKHNIMYGDVISNLKARLSKIDQHRINCGKIKKTKKTI